MKKVKSSTLFQMIVVTFVFHICVYVADVVTGIINGEHHSRTGKFKKKELVLFFHWVYFSLILDIIVQILKSYFC